MYVGSKIFCGMLWTEIIQKVGGVHSRLVWGETSPQFVSMYAARARNPVLDDVTGIAVLRSMT